MFRIWSIYKNSVEGLNAKIWLLAFVTLVNRSGSMVLPFLTVFLSDGLSFTKSKVAIVAFCYGLGSMLGSFLGGYLTDKFGAYKVASISLLLSCFGFLGFLISDDFIFLCVWSTLAITVTDTFRPAVMVVVGEHSDDKTITRAISLTRMAMNLGVAIGPVVGGLVIQYLSYSWLFIIDGLTCLLAGLIFTKYMNDKSKPVHVKKKSSTMEAIRDVPFMFFMLFNLINLLTFFQIIESIPLFITEFNHCTPVQLSLFFFFNGFAIFVLEMPLVHYLERKLKPLDCTILGVILIGLGYLCLLVIPDFVIAISLYSILIVIGEIINFPFITSIAHRRAGADAKGGYMGVMSLMFSMAFLLAPFGLNIVDHFGYHNTWYVMVFFCIISMTGLLFLKKYLAANAKAR